MSIDFKKLFAEFPKDSISWRAQSLTHDATKALALAYIDARDVMDLLDEVCGPAGWQARYPHANGKTVCEIGIKCGDEWIWKADGAGDSDIEAEKGALSDAFKRAAVRWGIGRYLYNMGTPWVPCESYKGNDGKMKFSKFTANPWDCLGSAAPQKPSSESKPAIANTDLYELKTLVALGKQVAVLSDFETKFLNDYHNKIAQYGDKLNKPSDKQLDILRRIAEKAKKQPLNSVGEPSSYATEGPNY